MAVKQAGIPMADAVKMMTVTPATVMGLKNKGFLAENMDADIVAFDEDVNIKCVFARGEKIEPV